MWEYIIKMLFLIITSIVFIIIIILNILKDFIWSLIDDDKITSQKVPKWLKKRK